MLLAIAVIVACSSITHILPTMLLSIYESGITPVSAVIGLFAVGILQMSTIWLWNDTERLIPLGWRSTMLPPRRLLQFFSTPLRSHHAPASCPGPGLDYPLPELDWIFRRQLLTPTPRRPLRQTVRRCWWNAHRVGDWDIAIIQRYNCQRILHCKEMHFRQMVFVRTSCRNEKWYI